MGPMFDDAVNLGGLSVGMVLGIVALVGLVVGGIWLRRRAGPEPEPRAGYRWSEEAVNWPLRVGLGLGIFVLVLLIVANAPR